MERNSENRTERKLARLSAKMMKLFNRKDTPRTPERRGGDVAREAHKVYPHFSDLEHFSKDGEHFIKTDYGDFQIINPQILFKNFLGI